MSHLSTEYYREQSLLTAFTVFELQDVYGVTELIKPASAYHLRDSCLRIAPLHERYLVLNIENVVGLVKQLCFNIRNQLHDVVLINQSYGYVVILEVIAIDEFYRFFVNNLWDLR